jgi:uncharacterized protein (TIGR00730 family)
MATLMKIKRVCVYCASSDKVDPVYFDAVALLAEKLVENNIQVVYGGGATGLMGKLADEVIRHGGHVIGIMPNFMNDVEWAHKHVPEFHFVGDMAERKKKFLEMSDALIALPGGCGTLEELFEAITLKRLGLFTKPILILNINGFYDHLVAMLDKCIKDRFMAEKHREMWTVLENPSEIMTAMENAPEWSENAIKFAKV